MIVIDKDIFVQRVFYLNLDIVSEKGKLVASAMIYISKVLKSNATHTAKAIPNNEVKIITQLPPDSNPAPAFVASCFAPMAVGRVASTRTLSAALSWSGV